MLDLKKLVSENNMPLHNRKITSIIESEWFNAQIVISETGVKVYVNGNKEPSLSVKKLSKHKKGTIGFFVGNNSGDEFANLTFSPEN